MKSNHLLTLINKTFIPDDAGKELFELINCRINNHHMELFSNEERFGKDISNAKNRIEELKAATSSLKKDN